MLLLCTFDERQGGSAPAGAMHTTIRASTECEEGGLQNQFEAGAAEIAVLTSGTSRPSHST